MFHTYYRKNYPSERRVYILYSYIKDSLNGPSWQLSSSIVYLDCETHQSWPQPALSIFVILLSLAFPLLPLLLLLLLLILLYSSCFPFYFCIFVQGLKDRKVVVFTSIYFGLTKVWWLSLKGTAVIKQLI